MRVHYVCPALFQCSFSTSLTPCPPKVRRYVERVQNLFQCVHLHLYTTRSLLRQGWGYKKCNQSVVYVTCVYLLTIHGSGKKWITSNMPFLSDTPWLKSACFNAPLLLTPADVPLLTVEKSTAVLCFFFWQYELTEISYSLINPRFFFFLVLYDCTAYLCFY